MMKKAIKLYNKYVIPVRIIGNVSDINGQLSRCEYMHAFDVLAKISSLTFNINLKQESIWSLKNILFR